MAWTVNSRKARGHLRRLWGSSERRTLVPVWSVGPDANYQPAFQPHTCLYTLCSILLGCGSVNPSSCCCWLGAQSCLTLCDLIGCSPPCSSVHGISQARIVEWVALSSRRSSPPMDRTHFSCIGRQILYH